MNSRNELKHYGVLGMKWGIRRARVKSANAEYKKSLKKANGDKELVKKAKLQRKSAKKDKSHDEEIANKLYSKQSKKANKAIARMKMGKAIGQSILFGSYGALKYNEARAKDRGIGRSAVDGILYNIGNQFTKELTFGVGMSGAKYLSNRWARENSKVGSTIRKTNEYIKKTLP